MKENSLQSFLRDPAVGESREMTISTIPLWRKLVTNQPGAPVTAPKSRVMPTGTHGKLGGTTGVISRPFRDGSFFIARNTQPNGRKMRPVGCGEIPTETQNEKELKPC